MLGTSMPRAATSVATTVTHGGDPLGAVPPEMSVAYRFLLASLRIWSRR